MLSVYWANKQLYNKEGFFYKELALAYINAFW